MQRQTQTQRQTLKYSPLQIQMLNLLHLTTMELEQRIKEELEENPILEEGKEDTASEDTADEFQDADDSGSSGEDDYPSVQDYQDWDEFRDDDIPDYKTYANNQSADNELYTRPMVESIGFRDDLKQQVHFLRLDERQQLVADFILDSLDEDGFLRRESEVIADDISFANSMFIDTEEVEMMLRVIQQLDPPGIAAKDLRECLLIQLQRIENQDEVWGWAYKIVSDTFDELGSRNYDKIMRVLNLDEECLKKAIQLITTLNPKPASGLRNDTLVNESIKPDFMLRYIEDSEIEVQLTWGNSPALRLNKLFTQMAEQKIDKATNQFLKNKMNSAKWFIDAIKQRQQTLLKTMNAIMHYQYDYFLTGDERKLRPMILKDIADKIGMDISTVSRVANSKYVQTEFGTFLLKSFFSEAIQTESGEEVSNKEVKKILEDCIGREDKRKPLADERLTEILKEHGYNIARRTVAKYREQMNIPVARLRKEL